MLSLIKFILYFIIVYVACFIYYIDLSNMLPLIHLTGVSVMEKYGYTGEEHLVESSDGFFTKIHRIGHGNGGGQITLLVPGIHCCSEIMFGLGPDHDLSYDLYNNGLDVWVANFRGSRNSWPNENISHTDDELTNFSFHEQGVYDISVQIDFVLQYTGKQKLNVVAGSMGANTIVALIATKPEYNEKIIQLVFAAPVGPFTQLSVFRKIYMDAIFMGKAVGHYLATATRYRAEVSHILCNHPMMLMTCWQFLDLNLGFNSGDLSNEMAAVALNSMFTGPYCGIYDHIMQLINTRKYVQRDHGAVENLRIYNSVIPPEYNISNIKLPIKLYYVEGDPFLNDEGKKMMFEKIPHIIDPYEIKEPFGHGNIISNSKIDIGFVNDLIKTLRKDTS